MTIQENNKWRWFRRIYWGIVAILAVVSIFYGILSEGPEADGIHAALGVLWWLAIAIALYTGFDWIRIKLNKRHLKKGTGE